MSAGLFDDRPFAVNLTQVEKFVVPPTSVLDAQQGYWQERRVAWVATYPALDRGESSGRTDRGASGLAHFDEANDETSAKIAAAGSAVTVFDPVLAEVAYQWWTAPGDLIYDPFAGGPTRGIVAASMGRDYIGVDVRLEQVDFNEDHALPGSRWVVGDASTYQATACDFVFSCPPYGSLEVYSEDPRDLSTMSWARFSEAYRSSIARSVASLRRDRFAAFVVGNFKERGVLRDLIGLTVGSFEAAGADYYSDLVLIPPSGSAALRAARGFPVNRRPMPRHQSVLVFIKGDARQAAQRLARSTL